MRRYYWTTQLGDEGSHLFVSRAAFTLFCRRNNVKVSPYQLAKNLRSERYEKMRTV